MFDYSTKAVEVALIASKIAKLASRSNGTDRLIVIEIIEAARNSAMAASKAQQNETLAKEWYHAAMQWAKVATIKSISIN